MLGIDLSHHNTITNWQRLKNAGVGFVYVKGTDGGGRAPATVAPQYVAGARSVDLPVGLYHYAQLSPSPEAQARVLHAEVQGLGAHELPPALDLEAPHRAGDAAEDFARRFIAELRRLGYRRVTLYANTSMLTGSGGLSIDDDPDVLIWAASYGPNDGARHPLNYRGRVDIHQYTSAGVVPGVTGLVDLNASLIDILSEGTSDMPLNDEDLRKVTDDTRIQVLNRDGTPATHPDGSLYQVSLNEATGQNNRAAYWVLDEVTKLRAQVDAVAGALSDDETAIVAEIRKVGQQVAAGGLDPAGFAAVLGPVLAPLIQAGVSEDQVRAATDDAIRAAFARAGQGGGV